MSGLMGGGGGGGYASLFQQQQSQKPQYQAQTNDMAAENAALFERIRRARAHGKQKTFVSDDYATPEGRQKAFLGASA